MVIISLAVTVESSTIQWKMTKQKTNWLKCCSCSSWMHETCAEEGAVIGDDDFICKNCVN